MLAQHAAGALNRMQANRQRFSQCRLGQAQVVRHRMSLAGADHQLLAEGALNVRKRHGAAVKAHVQAMVLHAGLAKTAVAARAGRRYGDALAFCKTADFRAHGLHDTGDLVAQGHGLLDAHGAKAAVLVVVQVRAANAAKSHGHQQLMLAHGGLLPVFESQILG